MKSIFFSYKWINITWYMAFAIFLIIIGDIILKIIGKDNKYRNEIEDYYFLELIDGFVGARSVYGISIYL
ncbi:hypothetical protein GOQ29_05900 [Clostridium sp. D2Q-14]|uniref:hypothetical protein n=1 Tax=Anaeromonas gelatinilytica TaxID=2683194 RepID=UPI00193B8790|nr:hypothetical protein [Anaeromonas gelatinilytica]MBS4535152.1 hypothetical protein [Anaeromonas gelatinilytica]